MATFCVKCGAPLGSGPFCVKCGANMSNVGTPPPPRSPSPVAQTPQPAAAPTSTGPAPAKQGMSDAGQAWDRSGRSLLRWWRTRSRRSLLRRPPNQSKNS